MIVANARSRITSQGEVSVPAEIRRRYGLGPGTVIEWVETGEGLLVKRAGEYSFEDLRAALFPDGPPRPRSTEELKAGIRSHMKKRHARR